MVRLADAKEIDDFAVEIIQHFHFRRLFMKENLCAARECLDIGRMLRENLNDLPRKPVLPSYV